MSNDVKKTLTKLFRINRKLTSTNPMGLRTFQTTTQ